MNLGDFKREKLTTANCPPALAHLLEKEAKTQVVCYDFTKDLNAMRHHLLALFKFSICISLGFTQNLRTFVVVLHDFPIKVEESKLYALVKNWKCEEDVQQAINTHS